MKDEYLLSTYQIWVNYRGKTPTCPPANLGAFFAFSAKVLPVTENKLQIQVSMKLNSRLVAPIIKIPVMQSPSKNPSSRRKRMTAGVPPIYRKNYNLIEEKEMKFQTCSLFRAVCVILTTYMK